MYSRLFFSFGLKYAIEKIQYTSMWYLAAGWGPLHDVVTNEQVKNTCDSSLSYHDIYDNFIHYPVQSQPQNLSQSCSFVVGFSATEDMELKGQACAFI